MLDPKIRDLARSKNFGALTVLLHDGQPMTHIMWVDATDDRLLVNTEVHRAKFKAMERDPRVTIAVWDGASPYRYGEVRGRVVDTTRGPEARAHIDQLARKYTGADYANPVQSERVIVHIEPERQRTQG